MASFVPFVPSWLHFLRPRRMTRLCVPILVRDVPSAKRDIATAAEAGADLIELRVDRIADAGDVRALVAACPVPALLTCRPEWEGGESDAGDAERFALLQAGVEADPHGTTWADVELAALARTTDPPPGDADRRVASSHDFKGRPDRLYNLLDDLNAAPAAVAKLVWLARSVRDNLEAFEVLANRQKPTVALCMGEAGLISRVLAKKFGGWATYAPLSADSATAPGQVSIFDLKRLYRWDAIGRDTRVYGVVADPVGHSMSPAVHNAAFGATGHDGVYLPLLVTGSYEAFKAFMETFVAFAPLHLSGLSVTIPHKENALRYLREKGAAVDPLAERIGAVNTITIRRDGAGEPTLSGTSTDYYAILDCVAIGLSGDAATPNHAQIAGRRVAVIGAGGTGRTAVAALAAAGAEVTVFNRTRDRADALAAEFDASPGRVVAAGLDALPAGGFDVYVNTTSLGMSPNVDASPFGDAPPTMSRDTVAFDTVYNPVETKFLRQARDAGARTVSGVEMFVRQAAGQFAAWTGRDAPTDVMRRAIESRLAAK